MAKPTIDYGDEAVAWTMVGVGVLTLIVVMVLYMNNVKIMGSEMLPSVFYGLMFLGLVIASFGALGVGDYDDETAPASA